MSGYMLLSLSRILENIQVFMVSELILRGRKPGYLMCETRGDKYFTC
jgi:hypothetical protein